MGKRKKTARSSLRQKKRSEPLATRFSCPECNLDGVVTVKICRKDKYGLATCNICSKKWKSPASKLSKPIDIYSDWIDNFNH